MLWGTSLADVPLLEEQEPRAAVARHRARARGAEAGSGSGGGISGGAKPVGARGNVMTTEDGARVLAETRKKVLRQNHFFFWPSPCERLVSFTFANKILLCTADDDFRRGLR